MARVEVALGAIEERQPLPAPGPYTFAFRKLEVKPQKDQTGYLLYAELQPEGYPEETIMHNWSLKPGAISASDATISIKKFLRAIGCNDLAESMSGFDTEQLLPKRFSATVKHEEFRGIRARLDTILGPVA